VGAGPDGNLGTADDVLVTGGRITFDRSDRVGVLQFGAPLLSGRYRSRLAGSVADLQGNPLGADFTWDFTIPTAQALASTPAHQSVWLSDSLRRVEVRFDERLSAASVTADALGVFTTNRINPLTIPGGVASISSDARAALLEFAQPIPDGVYRFVFTPETSRRVRFAGRHEFPSDLHWSKARPNGPATLSGLWTVEDELEYRNTADPERPRHHRPAECESHDLPAEHGHADVAPFRGGGRPRHLQRQPHRFGPGRVQQRVFH
jgi:hypothetical protein